MATYAKLSDNEIAKVFSEMRERAAASGKSPEQELWDFGQSLGIGATGIDQYMGWDAGTSGNWYNDNQPTIVNRDAEISAAYEATHPKDFSNVNREASTVPASDPTRTTHSGIMPSAAAPSVAAPSVAAPSVAAPSSTSSNQWLIDEANRRAASNGSSPELELWNFAIGSGMTPDQIDEYMGWDKGVSATWASTNVPGYKISTGTSTGGVTAPASPTTPLAPDAATPTSTSTNAYQNNYGNGQNLVIGYRQPDFDSTYTDDQWNIWDTPVGSPVNSFIPTNQSSQPGTYSTTTGSASSASSNGYAAPASTYTAPKSWDARSKSGASATPWF